jgi:hypothetical protein
MAVVPEESFWREPSDFISPKRRDSLHGGRRGGETPHTSRATRAISLRRGSPRSRTSGAQLRPSGPRDKCLARTHFLIARTG